MNPNKVTEQRSAIFPGRTGRSPRRRRSPGFTLIELLVVVAILGILAALLFPVLFTGRQRSRQAVCQSNLKQLGHAFALYADDWDGVLPAPGGLFGERNYWDQGSGMGLDRYLRNRTGAGSVWACPELTGWDNPKWEPRSYTMNTFLRDPPDVEDPKVSVKITDALALSEISAPADTLLLFEGTQTATAAENTGFGYVYRDGDWTHARGYWRHPVKGFQFADQPWHNGRNDYLFVDGHVKAMAPNPREPDRPAPGHDIWHVHKN